MISFVYFDVGGVLIQDFSGTNQWDIMLADMGIVTPEQMERFLKVWNMYKYEVACGRDVDSLIPIIQKAVGISLPPGYSLLSDFVSRFRKNPWIEPILTEAKKHSAIGLLTDMYPRMRDCIEAAGLLPNFTWDVLIDSSYEGVHKPDRTIYERAQERSGVPAGEILFIDNMEKNLVVPRAMGWHTYLYDSSDMKGSAATLLTYISSSF